MSQCAPPLWILTRVREVQQPDFIGLLLIVLKLFPGPWYASIPHANGSSCRGLLFRASLSNVPPAQARVTPTPD